MPGLQSREKDAKMTDVAQKSSGETEAEPSHRVAHTRLSAGFTAVVVAALVLILLVIFIAQNTQRSSVNFLWFHGRAPTAVVLLIAALAGALVVITVAVARILQLRRAASHSDE
jgi:uncharacterized integral membrane protein